MLATLLSKSSPLARIFPSRAGLGQAALLVTFVTSFLLGCIYHYIAYSNTTGPMPLIFAVAYQIMILIGYGALWLMMARFFQNRNINVARRLWSILLFGIGFIAFTEWFATLFTPTNPAILNELNDPVESLFNNETGAAGVWPTLIKMQFLSVLTIAFSFYLLIQLRELVLFKRTRSSQRNWHLLLILIILASFTFITTSPFINLPLVYEPTWLHIAIIPVAVGFMVINSFRIQWIVYLPFREKLITILSLALIVTLAIFYINGLNIADVKLPAAYSYLRFYSFPLNTFSILAVGFAFMYFIASLLMILFHLPTTGEFQRRTDERMVMQSLANLVNQAFDPSKLYASIASSPIEAGTASSAWLALSNLQSGSLKPSIVATSSIHPARVERLVDTNAIYEDVASSQTPVLLKHASADHRLSAQPGDGLGSLLAVPLIARDEMLGALFVTKDVSHGFEEDDVVAITMFAAQAALAIDNARLFEEQLEKERMGRELAIARDVQKKLLPQKTPNLPGVTLAASNVSAEDVGGDYYDFLEFSDSKLCFMVGDVSGKGASAAFYMAEMQGVFQSISRLTPKPSDFLRHANAALSSSLESNVFISAIYGMIDTQKEQLLLARAGHCPVARINLAGEATYLRSSGIGLGLDQGGVFERTLEEMCIQLQPGDVFVLYTDGVVESRNVDGEEYGYERLLQALQVYRHEDAQELHQALLADLEAFLGSKNYDDDMTLLVLKWHGIEIPKNGADSSQQHKTEKAMNL